MVQSQTVRPKNSNNLNQNKYRSSIQNNVFTMLAAFTGVVLGVLGSLGFVTTYVHSQLAAQTATLSHELVQMRPASDTLASSAGNVCPAPVTGGMGGGVTSSVAPAQAVSAPMSPQTTQMPAVGGMGGGQAQSPVPFTQKLVSGIFAHQNASISNTGANSTNTIKYDNTVTTTVTNDNNIRVTNNNPQTASSGNASSSQNTTAGTTNSGQASNTSSSNFSLSVNN